VSAEAITGSTVEPARPGPVLVADVEATADPVGLPGQTADGREYAEALLLVRVHQLPVAQVRLDRLDRQGWPAEALTRAIAELAGDAVNGHLRADSAGLAAGPGLGTDEEPACVVRREELLADPPAVSVVIPTRGRADRLADCVRSILTGSYPTGRITIFVVDNVPTDDSTRRVVEDLAKDADVRYLAEPVAGSASARNRALPQVETDLVAFTDDDAACDRHWLAQVVRCFADHESASVVTGLLMPTVLETPAQVWFEEYGGFSRGFGRRVFDLVDNVAHEPLYPYTAGVLGTGNNMAFRADALREIGGFDPALGNGTPALGGVDSEVLFRAVVLGHQLVYEPTALVHHEHRDTYDALRRQIYAYGAGQTAYLTKMMVAQPRLLPGLIRRIPRGLTFALSSSSAKNSRKRGGYPADLTRAELRGMAYGPLAYLRSRGRYGRHRIGAPRAGTPTPR
jgi:GT2 family glycosyltransferase